MRKLVVVGLIGLGVIALASPASADEPGERKKSAQLVRQAIALIVDTPATWRPSRTGSSTRSRRPTRRASRSCSCDKPAPRSGAADMHDTRALLERSIGARLHLGDDEPLPIDETRGMPGMVVGVETGIDV